MEISNDSPRSPLDRLRLAQRGPSVAMLVPAHREVTNPEDAAAFVSRFVDMVLKTPAYAHLFLMFDSPASEHENELCAVQQMKRKLIAAGRGEECHRIHMEIYRGKPKHMRSKPGSIQMWLDRWADRFEYMLMLDADSSLLPEDPERPETCEALARLVLALEDHQELAMVQSAIHVHTAPTLWGWFQSAGVGMSSLYHGQIFKWTLEGTVPSYGHNILFRTSDFIQHVSNTLSYLSHDFLDAADIETAGRRCVQTYHVLTCEEGEASLLGFLMRDLRWARGNAQWMNYLLTKKGLLLGPKIFLAIGILSYVWPLLASVLLVSSVFLMNEGMTMVSPEGQFHSQILFSLVITSLIVPKSLGSHSPAVFYGAVVGGWLMAPAVMLIQGVLFILGAFGTRWTIRGSRSASMDCDHVCGIVALFAPASILGCVLSISSADPRIAIVESIPGVGAIGAQVIVAHVDDATRIKNVRQVSSYAGLVPKKWQSGKMDRQNRISKRGPRLLRSILTEVAWCAIRYNSQFKDLYDRVRGGSKSRKKQAITAVARKILVIAWAMLRDGKIWQPVMPTSSPDPHDQVVPISTA